VFRNLIMPYPLKQTHYIRAMEIRPGAPQVVHHANVVIDRTASLRRSIPTIGRAAFRAWNCWSTPATASNPTAISSFGSPTRRPD
jgi:hypothetical protein